eukprot:5890466-Prymnesium_polylepis.1
MELEQDEQPASVEPRVASRTSGGRFRRQQPLGLSERARDRDSWEGRPRPRTTRRRGTVGASSGVRRAARGGGSRRTH